MKEKLSVAQYLQTKKGTSRCTVLIDSKKRIWVHMIMGESHIVVHTTSEHECRMRRAKSNANGGVRLNL